MPGLKDKTEREILVQQHENLKNLCINFEDFKENNKTDHSEIFAKLDNVLEEKVSNRLFYFTIAIIITAIMTLTAYTGSIKNEVVKNTLCRELLDKK